MQEDQNIDTRSEETPVATPESKPAFVEPKLAFVEPELVKRGDVTDVTAGFFGSFTP